MSVPTVEFLSKERAEILASRVAEFDSSGFQFKKVEQRSPISGGLDPYAGPWTKRHAAHLLARATMGPTKAMIDEGESLGLEGLVAQLLADAPSPEPPLNFNNENDPFTPVGETWTDKPTAIELIPQRLESLYGWAMGLLLNEGISAREKMTLFWHNHFVTSGDEVGLPKSMYQYIELLRNSAFGNFKELTKDITINPAMLVYLNGSQNTKFAPNENYARELLELFTIGKGEPAGPGDYTTFTEDDVLEISRILTGWRVRYDFEAGTLPEATFNRFFHDDGDKQLSERLGGAVISNNDEQEFRDLIDIIFQQEEASRFICRKLYRWFVYYVIDDEIEANVIEPMAQILRDNDFEIKPVLEALFSSEHFYDDNSLGCMIKNPMDFMLSTIKQFEVRLPDNFQQEYALWLGIYRFVELLQMRYFFPPSVAGWKAWYQEPTYYQLWINSVTLIIRQLWTDVMSTSGFESFNGRFRVDALAFTASMDNPFDPNTLIQDFAGVLFPVDLEQSQIDILKETLIPGLPDFEWTIEYQAYLDDPNNDEIRLAVETRLRLLLRAMMARPEYHLS